MVAAGAKSLKNGVPQAGRKKLSGLPRNQTKQAKPWENKVVGAFGASEAVVEGQWAGQLAIAGHAAIAVG